MRPETVPICGLIDNQLHGSAIQLHEISIDTIILFGILRTEDPGRCRKQRLLSLFSGQMEESDDVDIAWVTTFYRLDVFEEAAVDPLKTIHKANLRQGNTEVQ